MKERLVTAASIIPSDEELISLWGFMPSSADPLLSDDETNRTIFLKYGAVSPVRLRQFDGLDDFVKNSNNFHVYFNLSDPAIGGIYRRSKSFQRLCLLESDLVETALGSYDEVNSGVRIYNDPDFQTSLFQVYSAMSRLVDVRDPMRLAPDGSPDWNHLIR